MDMKLSFVPRNWHLIVGKLVTHWWWIVARTLALALWGLFFKTASKREKNVILYQSSKTSWPIRCLVSMVGAFYKHTWSIIIIDQITGAKLSSWNSLLRAFGCNFECSYVCIINWWLPNPPVVVITERYNHINRLRGSAIRLNMGSLASLTMVTGSHLQHRGAMWYSSMWCHCISGTYNSQCNNCAT